MDKQKISEEIIMRIENMKKVIVRGSCSSCSPDIFYDEDLDEYRCFTCWVNYILYEKEMNKADRKEIRAIIFD